MTDTRDLGRAWLWLCLALLLHVVDEALTGFLAIYNPTVIALRERFPWLPIPTFEFGEWLAGLLIATAGLLFLGRYIARGARWMRPAGYVFAAIMIVNGAGHIAATLAGRTVASVPVHGFMPGVYSSPVLLAGSVYLLVCLRRTR